MTDLSRKIFENYQIRKTKKQKREFIEFLSSRLPSLKIEAGGLGMGENIVLGDLGKSKVIFTAHYDTCAVLPFPNILTPKNIFLYILYNMAVLIPFFVIVFTVSVTVGIITESEIAVRMTSLIMTFGACYMLLCGKANKHTANDNTSGVITLCEIYQALSPEEREKAAFVFFDNEEKGMLGSSYFKKIHKKIIKDKLLINFDCVSDGDNIMVMQNKGVSEVDRNLLEKSFEKRSNKNILFETSATAFYPSDQAGFKKGVAVAAFKKSKIFCYYMDKIHTSKDMNFDETNIDYIKNSIVKLTKSIQ